jgi:hypothetical protein
MTHSRESLAAPAADGGVMRYVIAWLLGVPLSVLFVWYLISHLL